MTPQKPPTPLSLSALSLLVQDTIESAFSHQLFWVRVEITDVKKYPAKRWCFLKLIEKRHGQILAELKAVLWSDTYDVIARFEKESGASWVDGLEVTCMVRIHYHPRYGLSAQIQAIDASYWLGQMELERRRTLAYLVEKHPGKIQEEDGQWFTPNNQLPMPSFIQHVALITAEGSDGSRDFSKELLDNPYGYAFQLMMYPASVQGDRAVEEMLRALDLIEQKKPQADVVVMVRGGGSQTDFKAYDHPQLCERMALFPIPILTGIGHDRNMSIADSMVRSHKTPTKVAAWIVAQQLQLEMTLTRMKERLDQTIQRRLQNYEQRFRHMRSILQLAGHEAILQRGFSYLLNREGKIVNPSSIAEGDPFTVVGHQVLIDSKSLKIKKR